MRLLLFLQSVVYVRRHLQHFSSTLYVYNNYLNFYNNNIFFLQRLYTLSLRIIDWVQENQKRRTNKIILTSNIMISDVHSSYLYTAILGIFSLNLKEIQVNKCYPPLPSSRKCVVQISLYYGHVTI